MFGFHTPVNTKEKVSASDRAGPSKPTPSVRRSIADIESGTLTVRNSMTPPKTTTPEATKLGPAVVRDPEVETLTSPLIVVTASSKNLDRVAEAKACLVKGKLHINSSRNLKVAIKNGVLEALDRLYQLVKETDAVKGNRRDIKTNKDNGQNEEKSQQKERPKEYRTREDELIKKMEEHCKIMQENSDRVERLREEIEKHQVVIEKTYASVTACSHAGAAPDPSKKHAFMEPALHSVVVTAQDETETGEEVLEKIRQVINAKEDGAKIDKIRKAKDRKIIIGCRSKEEIGKITKKISGNPGFTVEHIKNKDPLVILYSVLNINSDDDITRALKRQNSNLVGLDDQIEIRYRRKTRNPHTSHVVARVPPSTWQRLTNAGAVHIDMQRIRVADQSPLIQCSRCLGYGHGKRFCSETVDVCSHCGGAHMRTECSDWLADAPPSCVNCHKAKLAGANHNTFSSECPVRRKWEAHARSTVAYC